MASVKGHQVHFVERSLRKLDHGRDCRRAFRASHGGAFQTIDIEMDAALIQAAIFVVQEAARRVFEDIPFCGRFYEPPAKERRNSTDKLHALVLC